MEGFADWAAGNLAENRTRGIFAEWLVGQALGVIAKGDARTEWDAVDLHYSQMSTEVKASGRSQTWSPTTQSAPRFGIAPQQRAWIAATDSWVTYQTPKRTADVYVFCLHQAIPASNGNVADPQSWAFWAIATSVLDTELGDQRTVGESTLNGLAQPVPWSQIRRHVDLLAENRR